MNENIQRIEAEDIVRMSLISEKVTELTKDGDLPFISAFVMAQDLVGAERVKQEVLDGKVQMSATTPVLVGSYARIDFIRWLQEQGYISADQHLEWFRLHWTGADPDDTDERNLAMWRKVNKRWRNDGPGTPYYRDSDKYLPSVTGKFPVYRGQRMTDKTGFSWSLRQDVARKFAVTGGGRAPIKDGLVLVGNARPHDVLAYLTGRGEDEVIIDPANVR